MSTMDTGHRESTGTALATPGGPPTSPTRFSVRGALPRLAVLRHGAIRIGLVIVGAFLLLAIFAPIFIHADPMEFGPDKLEPPSARHWLGTTQTGQDVLLQVLLGARLTIFMGVAAGFIATALAVVVGLIAGYYGGIVDEILSIFINVFLVLPALPLAIVLAGYVPVKGPLTTSLVVVVTGWAWGARVLRAQTLSMRERDYVGAARAAGESNPRIIFFEIFPNEIAIVVSGLIFTILYAIFAEIGLEFLGLSDITLDSWGSMIFWAVNNSALLLGAWWWIVPPGLCIALFGAGLAFINFGIDEITNPRLRDAASK